jgi:hypothetical protein
MNSHDYGMDAERLGLVTAKGASSVTLWEKRQISLLLFAGCDGDDARRDAVQSLNVPEGLAGCAISSTSAIICVANGRYVNAK